jgi:hypothetical protein
MPICRKLSRTGWPRLTFRLAEASAWGMQIHVSVGARPLSLRACDVAHLGLAACANTVRWLGALGLCVGLSACSSGYVAMDAAQPGAASQSAQADRDTLELPPADESVTADERPASSVDDVSDGARSTGSRMAPVRQALTRSAANLRVIERADGRKQLATPQGFYSVSMARRTPEGRLDQRCIHTTRELDDMLGHSGAQP